VQEEVWYPDLGSQSNWWRPGLSSYYRCCSSACGADVDNGFLLFPASSLYFLCCSFNNRFALASPLYLHAMVLQEQYVGFTAFLI